MSYTCHQCDKTFKTRSGKQKHMDVHCGKMYPCKHCYLEFTSSSARGRHYRMEHSTAPLHQCDVCFKSFIRPSDLTRHMLRHSDDRPVTCQQCEHKSKNMDDYKIHRLIHTPPVPCSQCDHIAKNIRLLKLHIRLQHPHY